MLLQNKNAIVYGAGGSLGSEISKALAAEGAKVFVTGRTLVNLQKVANEIISAGGKAKAAQVDALNEQAVKQHLDEVIQEAGTIDISFNLIGIEVQQNIPLADMSVDAFAQPVFTTMRTHFITDIAAARVMKKQQTGVILSLTATPGGIGYPLTGGFAPSCCALECFSKNLAAELGIYNVRVVNIRSGGSPDTRIFCEAIEQNPEVMKTVLSQMAQDTMLKKLPMMKDIVNVAVFLSSSLAGMITGVTIDVTGGTTAGLNYRVNNQDNPAKVMSGK